MVFENQIANDISLSAASWHGSYTRKEIGSAVLFPNFFQALILGFFHGVFHVLCVPGETQFFFERFSIFVVFFDFLSPCKKVATLNVGWSLGTTPIVPHKKEQNHPGGSFPPHLFAFSVARFRLLLLLLLLGPRELGGLPVAACWRLGTIKSGVYSSRNSKNICSALLSRAPPCVAMSQHE